MKNFLFFLDKPEKDIILERMMQESVVRKCLLIFSFIIIFSLITMIFSSLSVIKHRKNFFFDVYSVNMDTKETKKIVSLPFPFQSFKNVASWLSDAIKSSYSFDFINFDDQVQKASYYFTDVGYKSYLDSLELNDIKSKILKNRVQVSILPLQQPVYINGGVIGKQEFWKYRVPVMVDYYNGTKHSIKKMLVEVLVVRVDTNSNIKGLGIAQFEMKDN